MANIMINEVCNLRCKYCFASEYVGGPDCKDMTFENFVKAIDFVNRSARPARIGIIGGEPLLHPRFTEMVDYAVANCRGEQEVLVFTNGLLLEEFAEYLAKRDVNVLINVNSPRDIGEKKFDKVVRSIEKARLKGLRITPGVNLYTADLNVDFVLDLIKKYAFKGLRIGLTCPTDVREIEGGSLKYFMSIREKFLELIEECAKLGCVPHLDCQRMPSCVLKPEYERLQGISDKYGVALDVFGESGCTPVVDILQDLSCVRCFGVSCENLKVPLDRFENEEEITDYFKTQVDNIGLLVARESECTKCKMRAIGHCQAGCLKFKLDDVLKIISNGCVN